MDSETKPCILTIQCDKDAGSHIYKQVLLARFYTNTINVV